MENDPHLETLGGRVINYAIMFAVIGVLLFVLWLIAPHLQAWVKPPPI